MATATATTYTKEFIQTKIATDARWTQRALVVLFEMQTADEQTYGETAHNNGAGFNSSDSRYLSYCAKYVMSGRPLSGQHLAKCAVKLQKYWRQIKNAIEANQTH
jgi:hypothetical protein